MKKMITRLLVFVGLVSFLGSCNPKPPVEKIKIPYSATPSFITISALDLRKSVLEDQINMIVLLSLDGCANCEKAKTELTTYAKDNHCNTYNVNVTKLSTEEHQAMKDATSYDGDDTYVYPYSSSYPMVYLFYSPYVVSVITSNFTKVLNEVCEVVSPE